MTYKNIIVFQTCGKWHADYLGACRFALHRASCRTKADAYKLAKEQVDYMNRRA